MGEKIVKKIKGMSWTTKISLMLVFTLILSVAIYGVHTYKLRKAEAASGDVILLWDTANGAVPGGWTSISGVAGAFNGVFPRAAASYGAATAGSDTHTHSLTSSTSTGPSATTTTLDVITTPNEATSPTHTHTWGDITSGAGDVRPPFKNLIFIRATNPTTIPAKAIGIFDTGSLPSGWTTYAALDGRYLRGFSDNATGGAATHTHTAAVTSAAAASYILDSTNDTSVARNIHTHDVSGSLSTTGTNAQPYVEVVFAYNSSGGAASIPTGLIAMFDAAPTGNWSIVSNAAPWTGNFLKGATSYGTTGGSSVDHNHGASQAFTSGGPSQVRTIGVAGARLPASDAHTHGVTYSIAISGNPLPVYRDTIFAKYTAPAATTTLADGANPSSVTIAPGAAITDLDAFTLQTSAGTDTVTAVVVTLGPAGAFNNIAQVDITDNSNVVRCTAVSNPGSNTITFPGGTCTLNGGIPVISASPTTYKVRITPKTHALMPVPPGASYATTGTVTSFTCTNAQAGTDSGSATITIDNLSPSGATATSGTAGNQKVTVNWTTSSSSDFNATSGSVIYRWAAGSAGAEVPAEGSAPAIGSTNGTATAACVVSSAASTALSKIDGSGGSAECTNVALTNGLNYTYKAFQKDTNGNYDVGVSIGTFTPTAPATTTLADGTNPSSVTIAPGAAITDLDAFTLQTSAGTDTVTAVVVTLGPAGAFNNIAQVDITDNSNVVRCTAVSNPGSNTITFPGGTCVLNGGIPVIAASPTTYKVRITPKTHALMPVPPGASYATTGTVTSFTSTNSQAGTDGGSATITIDNLSPNGATATSGTAGNQKVTVNWTTSSSSDFNATSGSVIYRWAAGSAGAEVPAEGSAPAIGSTNGTATAACVVSSAASTALSKIDGSGGSAGECTTAALTNGQQYTYKAFQKDTNGNYDVGVSIGTFTPAAACTYNQPSLDLSPNSGTITTDGGNKVYTLTIMNNDSGCTSTTFNLSKNDSNPTNFNASVLSQNSVALNSGESNNSITVTVYAKSGETTGTNNTYVTSAPDANHAVQNSDTVVTNINITNPLLHNSVNLSSTKWGSAWGITGGKYGEFTCGTCHEPRATNIKGVKNPITALTDAFPGSAVDFRFTSGTEGGPPYSMGDDTACRKPAWTDEATCTTNGGTWDGAQCNLPAYKTQATCEANGGTWARRTTSTSVCEVCHSITKYHRYDTTSSVPTEQTNYSHYNANDCTNSCHKHNTAFSGAGGACDGCHWAPPTGAPLAAHAKHYGITDVPTAYGDVTFRSTATAYGFSCGKCHLSGPHMDGSVDGSTDDISFDDTTDPKNPGGSYAAGTCSNLYCHSNVQGAGGSGAPSTYATPTWGGAVTCASCHKDMDTDAAATGSHTKHAQASAIACATCHNGYTKTTVASATHVNNLINLSFSGSGTGTTYSQGVTSVPGNGYGTCSTSYCHGAGTPTWGGAALTCSSCHSSMGAGTSGVAYIAKHQKHTDNTTTKYIFACENCHDADQTAHAGGLADAVVPEQAAEMKFENAGTAGTWVNKQYGGGGTTFKYTKLNASPYGAVAPTPAYAKGAAGGSDNGFPWTNGSCSNVWCHSNANPIVGSTNTYSSVAWNAALTCTSCHRGADTFALMGTATGAPDRMSTSHKLHLATDIDKYNNKFKCDECHAETTADNSSSALNATTGYQKHVDGAKSWKFSTTLLSTAINQSAGTYAGAGGACTSTYCHSKGQLTTAPFTAPINTTLAWNGGTSNCTSTCHGGNDTYANVNTNGPVGQHKRHIATTATNGYNYTCDECHAETVVANTSTTRHATTGYDRHVNTLKDWKFSANISYPDGSPSRDSGFSQDQGSYSGGNCTNLYCHSKGTRRTADPVTYQYTGDHAPYTTPSWTATLTCNGCHGDASNTDGRPAYADNTPKDNSHQTGSHKAKGCQECHWATTQNGTSIIDRTKHVNFAYNVSNSATTLTYAAGTVGADGIPAGGQCTALPATGCHGAATWGVTEINCLTCHNAITDNGDGAPTRRLVTTATGGGEFGMTWSHKRTASSSATYPTAAGQASKYDCCVCHLEGVASTGAVNATYHKNNLIDLRNPDDGLGTGLTPFAAEKLPTAASGTNWTNPTYVYASDDNRAVFNTNAAQNDLCVTGFGFAITAVPTNITVVIEGNGTDATAVNRQIRVGLTKTGCALIGTRKTGVQLNQTTDTKMLSGGGTDKWGTTWTAAEVNASTFGVLISDNDLVSGIGKELNIDSVKVVIDAFTAFSRDTASATIEPWVTNVQNNLCLKCHDSDASAGAGNGGAKSNLAWVPGGSILRPFGTAPTHTPGTNVLDVNAHFATAYASFHPIKGKQNNSYCNNNTMVAPWNALSTDKTPGTPSDGYLISCWDCHNALKTAHGGDPTLRAAYSRPADAPTPLCSLCHKDTVYAADLKGTGDTFSAFGAGGHALDSTPADGKRDDGLDAAADSHIGSRHSGAINDFGCQHCHSSKISADPGRPIRAEEVHGFNTFTDATTTWPSGGQKPYAFIRNKETFRGIEPRKVGASTYTSGCTHSNVDDANSVCEAKHDDNVKYIYGPGGAY